MTELPEITFRLGSCETLLIKASVIPSLRYSVSGVPLMLVNGRIAMESIAVRREDKYKTVKAATDNRPAKARARRMARRGTSNLGRRAAGTGGETGSESSEVDKRRRSDAISLAD